MNLTVAEHPRAVRGIRRARAAGGLAGFLLAAWAAHGAGLPAFDVLLRGLVAGVIAHGLAWAGAVAYWRAAIVAELEAVRRRRLSAREAADRVLRDAAAATPPR